MKAAANECRPVRVPPPRFGVVFARGGVATMFLVGLMAVRASDGSVDSTFGHNGAAALPNFSASVSLFPPLAMVLQPDGRIVTAGATLSPGVPSDFLVVRHHEDGSLDTTFGTQGRAIAEFGGADGAFAVALQTDGKIVSAGVTRRSGSGSAIAVARFHRDGRLDAAFGQDGKVVTDMVGASIAAQAVAIQSDAKIVVAGVRSSPVYDDFVLARYLSDGALDRTFGLEGKIVADIPWGRAFALAVLPDGKIVVAGATQQGGIPATRAALIRYNSDGTRDVTFGTGGLAMGPAHVSNAAFAMALQPDGKIVVTGSEGEWTAVLSLYRFNPDGSLDSTFTPPDPLSAPGAASLALQEDGKIVVGTRFFDVYDVSGARGRAVGRISLARYHSDGSLDTSFATGGYVYGKGTDAVAIRPDGRIVAIAGSTELVRYENPSLSDFLRARMPPRILAQPVAQRITSGSTVVFSIAATGGVGLSYQWIRDGIEIADATRPSLVIPDATSAHSGSYTVAVANRAGRVTSAAAALEVVPAAEPSRLVNFSILASLAGGQSLTLGTVLGGAGTTGHKPLLARAAGPALSQFGVRDSLATPTLIVRETSAGARVLASNSGWGGTPALVAAFAEVGAFRFSSPTSHDAAVFFDRAAPLAAGSYTMQVTDETGAGGFVLAELYDATPQDSFAAATPRLINVSVLKDFEFAASLTAGFTIRGSTARTLLVRTLGPSLGLEPFYIARAMPAPQVTLTHATTGETLASSRDWEGDAQIAQAAARAGAQVGSGAATRDAMLLVTLAPGAYTVHVGPAPSTAGGFALLDVFEVP